MMNALGFEASRGYAKPSDRRLLLLLLLLLVLDGSLALVGPLHRLRQLGRCTLGSGVQRCLKYRIA